ncbi:hypothetical protein L228DRAFT_238996 [Xylona heveae TC161]|uniref:Uncharacterized protein n=1 Tax=Xylona heveae (strain CBS 132557 / TC161) TaxID=1328760 RepID=A0A165GB16_XYLHT|nr:hypothetical protein L228DRAFT_238996 [Xylona heveae TC161]KZF21968.1 hypothetical protein L228DRAFT_238996 [Xylona heveae TC161]
MNNPRSIFTVPRDSNRGQNHSPSRPDQSQKRHTPATPSQAAAYSTPQPFRPPNSSADRGYSPRPFYHPSVTPSEPTPGHTHRHPTHQNLSQSTSWSWSTSNTRPKAESTEPSSSSSSLSGAPLSPKSSVPTIAGRKRKASLPLEAQNLDSTKSADHGLHRRRKRQWLRSRHSLDSALFNRGAVNTNPGPPSPLFFSRKSRARPPLPPRFSTEEAGAKMLSKARGEDTTVKTVTLARGSFAGGSPPRATSTPGSRASFNRINLPRSITPDLGEHAPGLQLLAQVGLAEFLEHDDRACFVIDLANATNYGPGPLHILFANSALRASGRLLRSIAGEGITPMSPGPGPPSSSTSSSSSVFSEFKAWATALVTESKSVDANLPPFTHAGVTWTSLTMRKRFRIIKAQVVPPAGTLPSEGSSADYSNPPLTETSIVSATLSVDGRRNDMEVETKDPEEPQDYFSGVPLATIGTVHGAVNSEDPPLSTIESPGISHSTRKEGLGLPEPSPGNLQDTEIFMFEQGSPAPASLPLPSASTVLSEALVSPRSALDRGFFDWTRLANSPDLPSHIQFARSVDWASTSLGPMETWPADLRQMCNLIMASPHPAALYWGEDMVTLYNEAYILLAGQKHPRIMGQAYRKAWGEIWDEIADVIESARLTGQATMKLLGANICDGKDDDCLFINRGSGELEESYFSWSIIPLVGEDGSVVGLYNPAFEKTRRKIAERRMLTLREVGERTAVAREVKDFWAQVLKGLEYNDYDTPFALLYSVEDESDSDGSSTHSSSVRSNKQCILEGTLGVPEKHPAAKSQLDLRTSTEGFAPAFRDAIKSDGPILLEIEKGTLAQALMEGIQWRGFGDPCKAAVVCPIHPTTGDSVLGFLVIGVNPRRPYDEDYNLYLQLLSRQLATSMASVVLFEEEIRRGEKAARLAALDRIELSQQLAARTKEAVESETKFTRMAEFAPVGMLIANSEGHITYCNDMWYEISRHPRTEFGADTWIDSVVPDDKELARDLWRRLVIDKIPSSAEFRFQTPWQDKDGNVAATWVLFSAYPEKYEDGSLKSIFGCITNISQQKWAEDFQKKRREEALELKRQQENFIDITSHEMRNPLSAILQCADEVVSSLDEYRANASQETEEHAELIEGSIDAAQTIMLCAQHQKRIVDDVLTLSKLDSALLVVTPVDVQPIAVMERALKMFEGELQTADIELSFRIDDSYHALGVDWVRLDPSRLLQVLINLTTNAIKFTTNQSKRVITVVLGASKERPSNKVRDDVSYFPSRAKRVQVCEGPDWGDGEKVFIHFAVNDTGRGLSENEKKLLFLRFSQASPRTHVQYGGSGLGLFISRELTELQGGEIGVSSECGKGSTFAFYIMASRTGPPENPVDLLPALPKKLSGGKLKSSPRLKPAKSMGPAVPISPVKSDKPAGREELKVLIVEDNLVNQRVLQKQLRNIGCVVHVANHGGEALERLKQSKYWRGRESDGTDLTVILMDLEMPVMDGLTCAKRIRELQSNGSITKHVPIIAVTANTRLEQIDTALAAGMDAVVSKPFRIPELIPKIEELSAKFKPTAQTSSTAFTTIPEASM